MRLLTIFALLSWVCATRSSTSTSGGTPPSSSTTSFVHGLSKLPATFQTVLSDIDGTLLTSNHEMPAETIAAIRQVQAAGFQFYPCTGRSRRSAANAAGPDFVGLFGKSLDEVPGVYQQGLQVYGPGGALIYEQLLDLDIVKGVEEFAREQRVALIAYCSDQIFTQRRDAQTDKITIYHEPIPTVHASGLHTLPLPVHKLIFLAEDDDLAALRPLLEASALGAQVSITKAVPGMLEVLPLDSNKGAGVERLLRHLEVDPAHAVSFGDGENDLEFLALTGLGVAVGNAKAKLKLVADVVLERTNDENGVGECLKELCTWRKAQEDRGAL